MIQLNQKKYGADETFTILINPAHIMAIKWIQSKEACVITMHELCDPEDRYDIWVADTEETIIDLLRETGVKVATTR